MANEEANRSLVPALQDVLLLLLRDTGTAHGADQIGSDLVRVQRSRRILVRVEEHGVTRSRLATKLGDEP
jgi:hypothetical protein